MAIKTEFMCKYMIQIILNNTMFYSPNHITIVYQDSNQQTTYQLSNNYGCCIKMKQQWPFFVTISFHVWLESIIGNDRKTQTHPWTWHSLQWSICIACFRECMGWMEGYECGRVFLKTKEWKKELREEKLVENIGQVMQTEI